MKKKNKKAMFTNGSDEWHTPKWLFKQLNKEFHFVLDAAATKENTLCKKFFSKENSALNNPWPKGKWTFCNPPYSLCAEFAAKALSEMRGGSWSVLLVPARVETRWFCNSVHGKAQVRFFKGRVRFSDKGSAPFPSVVLVFGKKPNTKVFYKKS